MRVLLLGGNGFVGRSIKKFLIKKKISFYAPSSKILNLKEIDQIENFLIKKKISHIINSAGKVGGILSNIKNQKRLFEDNMEINYNLLKTASKQNIASIINIGSSCMYPKIYENKMKENYLMSGYLEDTNFGYGLAKLVSSFYLKLLKENNNLNYTTIIPCNLYGPNDNFDPESSHLIAAIIEKIFTATKNKEQSIEVWGDGSSKREFLYVDDLAEFVVNLLKSNLKFPDFLNIGFGTDFTVKQYYKRIINLVNPKIKMIFNKKYPAGMKRKLMDSSLAKKKYGWLPKTSLDKGLIKTIKYYEKNEL
jgi:GDP-L-fucose synthase